MKHPREIRSVTDLNKDPDYKRDSSSHFCRTVTASTCINDAGMLSKWKVNVLESVYQRNKAKSI